MGNRKNYRLSHWMKLFWSLLFIVMMLSFLFVRQRVQKMQTEQTVSGLQDTLSIYVNGVDQSAESVEQYLYLSLDKSQDIACIESDETEMPYRIALQNVNDTMNRIIGFNPNICDIVYSYQGNGKNVRIHSGTIDDYRTQSLLEEQIFLKLEDMGKRIALPKENYAFYQVNDQTYIVHYYKIRNSYLATSIAVDTIFSQLESLKDPQGVDLFLADFQGNLLDCTIPDIKADLPMRNGTFACIGEKEYLITSTGALRNSFRIGTLTNKELIAAQGRFVMEAILVVFVLITGICFLLIIVFGSRFILQPIDSIVQEMRRLGTGDFQARIQVESPIQEYQVMGSTFNQMSQEIKNLKIENYEHQIQVNKAQMQYLQLQVTPHFYLNALNIIYSLAQVKDCAKIQQVAMHLVHYSRYMFHNVKELVTLEEELRHVEEYLEIQKIRFGDFNSSMVDVDGSLRKLLVPPFVVQSFVENSVKYAVRREECGNLWVSVRKSEELRAAVLTIRDDGPGYSAAVIQAVQKGTSGEKDGEEHVGIRNVQERLRIIYGEKASITIYNDHGAVTEVRLPLILQE